MGDLTKFVKTFFDRAMKERHIKVFYQPEIRALTKRICGFEALARWIDPDIGIISPGVFIPVLEQINRIHELDLYMIREVCADQRRILEDGLVLTKTSVNLSRHDFDVCDIFAEIEKIRLEYGIDRRYLNIEITESVLQKDDKVLHDGLEKFLQAGYQVWMDDFGSGYSSLNNLKDYKFDCLKIDMGFLREFSAKPQSKVILAAIVNMAKQLGINTLAEGVETQEQFDFLKSIGCEKVQGFLFGHPMPIDEDIMTGKKLPMDIENADDDNYYRKIGMLNVLSYDPIQKGKLNFEIMNSKPLYVIEEVAGHYNYLYTNKAYRQFMLKAGHNNVEESLYHLNNAPRGLEENFKNMLAKCVQSGRIENMDCVYNGTLCNINMRLLARDDERKARTYVLSLTDLSDFSIWQKVRDHQQSLQYLLSIYDRVDLFRDDGKCKNIYLEVLQHKLVESDTTAQELINRYAHEYVVCADREAFLEFYNLDTVRERALKTDKDHITAIFHSCDENGKTTLQMYILIPFKLNGQNMVISCIRKIDGLETVGTAAMDELINGIKACYA